MVSILQGLLHPTPTRLAVCTGHDKASIVTQPHIIHGSGLPGLRACYLDTSHLGVTSLTAVGLVTNLVVANVNLLAPYGKLKDWPN